MATQDPAKTTIPGFTADSADLPPTMDTTREKNCTPANGTEDLFSVLTRADFPGLCEKKE